MDDADDAFDFRLYAIWDLRNLEDSPEGAVCEGAVRQAAMWICYAGEQLRKLCVEGYEFEGRLGISIGKYRNREWRGFNKLRWAAWDAELKAAGIQLVPDSDAKIIEAIGLMERWL
jgi:hypothetical protein